MKKGQILIISVIFITVILVLTTSLFSNVTNFVQLGSNSITREQGVNLAEAGIENTLWQLNQTASVCGTCQNETTVGSTGSFKVTITDKNSQLKTITSKGCIPNCTNPRASKTVKVDVTISTDSISFRYAAQVGDGGMDMSNSSKVNGTVYSNASITKGGGSGQTITGDAWAVGSINPAIDVQGQRHPGSPPSVMPTFNYQEWEDLAANGGTINCSVTPSECSIDSTKDIGPKKYIGNLSISNNVIVTMKGPVWVSKDISGNGGNFSMSQGGTTLKLDPSFHSNNTVLIIDGTVDLTQGGNFQTTTDTPKGYITLVTTSTSSQAIQLTQSGSTAIFYALDGGAILSQSAHVAALVAKSLNMANSATLDYDSGLAGAQFSTCSTCPGASWAIKKGTYRIL